jgi:hypothetical protein
MRARKTEPLASLSLPSLQPQPTSRKTKRGNISTRADKCVRPGRTREARYCPGYAVLLKNMKILEEGFVCPPLPAPSSEPQASSQSRLHMEHPSPPDGTYQRVRLQAQGTRAFGTDRFHSSKITRRLARRLTKRLARRPSNDENTLCYLFI